MPVVQHTGRDGPNATAEITRKALVSPEGVEHQHFNTNLEKPAVWMAFINRYLHEYVASEITQTEASPEWKKREEAAGRL